MNLFAKIFIGFWLSSAAIVVSWMLAAQYFDPVPSGFDSGSNSHPPDQGPPPRAEGPPPRGEAPPPRGKRPSRGDRNGQKRLEGPKPPRSMFRIYYGLQNVEAEELPGWIKQQEEKENIDILLVDKAGTEIFGRSLVPGAKTVASKLAGFRRRTTHREGKVQLFGQELYRPEWGQLSMIIATHPPASPLVTLVMEHLWLRLLLALIISGGISYLISRYLTRSLKNLQQASRALAEGNLDTRIEVATRGGDETAHLARDFNSMASQLQEQIQAQKRLLNDVSHELRSPLARLKVALALAERDPSRVAELLSRIDRETERLDELIGQLLTAPDTSIELEDSIDLVSLLAELCDDAKFEVQTEHKNIVFETASQEAVVRSHGDLLKKALENVIRNALHYSPPESSVQVRLLDVNGRYRISVQDAGPGIPEPELEKIFEAFYRVDEARQRETGGFGLGLSIAHRVITQHRGSISACNMQPGLQICIDLPIA
jgi:signal transduction histidine kinase